MTRPVAPDEEAVEIAAAGDIGTRLNDSLAAAEKREAAELSVLRRMAPPAEQAIVMDLIRLNEQERARISKTRFIFALVAQRGRRLAGLLR